MHLTLVQEYKEKLELFTKNAAEVRELNATYNADNNDKVRLPCQLPCVPLYLT